MNGVAKQMRYCPRCRCAVSDTAQVCPRCFTPQLPKETKPVRSLPARLTTELSRFRSSLRPTASMADADEPLVQSSWLSLVCLLSATAGALVAIYVDDFILRRVAATVVAPLIILALVLIVPRAQVISKRIILFALVCGAASTVPAMLWEFIASVWEVVALQTRDLSPFMIGFIEEWCKVACLYSFLRRKEFNWRTATLLGLYAGLGFATIENLIYSTRIIQDGSHALPSLGIFLLSRSITAVMHALWSMLACRILLFYKKDTLQFHYASINGFLLVAALHGIWDLPILINFDREPTLQMILHDPRLSCLPISLVGTILMVCFMYLRRQEEQEVPYES